MTPVVKKRICSIAGVAALVVMAVSAHAATDGAALEKAAIQGSVPLDIRVAQGKLSGHFSDRPLGEVLEALRGQVDFAYQGDEDLLEHPVSGRFDGVPVLRAVKQLLEPFHYTIIFGENETIERLHITSLRRPWADRRATAVPVAPQTADLDLPSVEALPGVELTWEERLLFEIAEEEFSPPPELLEDFEPWQDPGSEETGPEAPADFLVEELPEFEPVVSETGPDEPDLIVEELPQFEPIVSETGPSLEVLEQDELSPGFPG